MPMDRQKKNIKQLQKLNKILEPKNYSWDGVYIRVPSLRSHSQALTIKLKQKLTIEEIKQKISQDNQWVKVIDNDKEDILKYLTPQATSETLDIAIGLLNHHY